MQRYTFLFVIAAVLLATSAFAQNFVSQEDFKRWLDSGKPIIIVDIRPSADYKEKHFKGSLETDAYPADTEDAEKKLDSVLPTIMESQDDVIIIRPPAKRGRISAIRAYNYFSKKGVPESRLYILEGGIETWPYPGMLE
jgi:rhodanese-related sulfurtransferase